MPNLAATAKSNADTYLDMKAQGVVQIPEIDSDDYILTDMNFLSPDPLYDTEKPYSMDCLPAPGGKKTNIIQTAFRTRITNARGLEHLFSPSQTSFGWFNHNLTYDIASQDDIDRYMREMEKVLEDRLQAKRVVAYDYVIRHNWVKGQPRPDSVRTRAKRPITGAHLDIDAEGAKARVRFQLPDESESLLRGRHQIVNCWRPLIDTIESFPLATCDSRTLHKDDLVPSDVIFPHLEIGAFEVWFNQQQRWYYLKHQKKHEVLLMMNFDSENPEIRCAHSAFEDPSTPAGAPDRESIEVRFMAFHPPTA